MITLYERIQIDGIMPERALLRLKRAGIPLYDIQKPQNKRLLLKVKRTDLSRVFSLYPSADFGEGTHSSYVVSKLGGVGVAKGVDFCKKRVGFLLGGLAFCILTLAADSFVFGIEFVGTDVYARETAQILEENGIKLFAPYKGGREDLITAKLLALDYVEFCSVKKVGGRIRVETRLSPFAESVLSKGEMKARHAGEVVALTVLRGSALKKVGDTVAVGEPLVGNWFSVEEGGQVRVEVIARAQIACVCEAIYADAQTEEEAFANAYLSLALGEKDEIKERTVTKTDEGFHVKICYVVTENMNL